MVPMQMYRRNILYRVWPVWWAKWATATMCCLAKMAFHWRWLRPNALAKTLTLGGSRPFCTRIVWNGNLAAVRWCLPRTVLKLITGMTGLALSARSVACSARKTYKSWWTVALNGKTWWVFPSMIKLPIATTKKRPYGLFADKLNRDFVSIFW